MIFHWLVDFAGTSINIEHKEPDGRTAYKVRRGSKSLIEAYIFLVAIRGCFYDKFVDGVRLKPTSRTDVIIVATDLAA